MKKITFLQYAALSVASTLLSLPSQAQRPLPAYEIMGNDTACQIFVYSPGIKDGLHVAYLTEGQQWQDIGQLCASDYGPWGAEKKMYDPFVLKASDGTWRLLFSVNNYAPCIAVAYSEDLVTWRPQDYPRMTVAGCTEPIAFENADGGFDIYFRSTKQGPRFLTGTADFRHFSRDEPSTIEDVAWLRDTATVAGKNIKGNLFDVPKVQLDYICHYFSALDADNRMSSERMADDEKRFAGVGNVAATLQVDAADRKAISDKLIGVFFEDISRAADGGLYAELVQNRDFEYNRHDHGGWNATTAWSLFDIKAPQTTPEGIIRTDTVYPLSKNNRHYIILKEQAVANTGFDGMPVVVDSLYDFSFQARLIGTSAKRKKMEVQLIADNGDVLATEKLNIDASAWKQYRLTLRPELTKAMRENTDASRPVNARLVLSPKADDTEVAVDMVSLFPRDTYKGHGLRRDLAEAIAALQPKFVRFPGGCATHGNGIGNIYHWNHTVGDWQDRMPDRNIWGYHQTRGLGFAEYFQFCDDIGAEPLPVLAAGVPCQNSAADASGYAGQQGGIPFYDPKNPNVYDMNDYVAELLDMIAWARKHYHLNYIGIGNEDLISTDFEERYLMICKAIKERYPDITVIGTVGPFHYPSADYIEGWRVANAHKDVIDMVDEHYYEQTGWFLNHQDYYDNYDRTAPKVYIGEYASKTRTLESALAEAAYLCSVERNGDVVAMTSYAPLLCDERHANWNPDLIYFNATNVTVTPSYETQRLFSTHSGNEYVNSRLNVNDSTVRQRVAASVVRDSRTGHTFLKVVNALPRTTSLHVNGIDMPAGCAVETFCGQPSDKQVSVSRTTTTTAGTINLAPYSVTVITL